MFSDLGFLTVGYLHTENCKNSKYLERSLESLISFSKGGKNYHQLSIVVLLWDCSHADIPNFLKRINSVFRNLVEHKMLQIVRTPDEFFIDVGSSSYWESLTWYSSEYVERSKALTRDMAFLWKFATTQSDYFIQFTDHVIVKEDIVLFLSDYVKDKVANDWLWAETVKGVMTGRVYNTKTFPELIETFNFFGRYLPANFIVLNYHLLKYSWKVYNIPRSIICDNYTFTGDNPAADITTSLTASDLAEQLQDIYKNQRGYFWATSPKVGDFILIDFKSYIWIDRLLIETGGRLYEDIIPGATLSVVFADSRAKNKPECNGSSYTKIADFPGAILALNGREIFPKPIGCVKIEITQIGEKRFRSWLMIRTLAVFKKQ